MNYGSSFGRSCITAIHVRAMWFRFKQFIDTRIFTAQCHYIENPAGEKNVAVAVHCSKGLDKKVLLENLFDCLHRHTIFTLRHISVFKCMGYKNISTLISVGKRR